MEAVFISKLDKHDGHDSFQLWFYCNSGLFRQRAEHRCCSCWPSPRAPLLIPPQHPLFSLPLSIIGQIQAVHLCLHQPSQFLQSLNFSVYSCHKQPTHYSVMFLGRCGSATVSCVSVSSSWMLHPCLQGKWPRWPEPSTSVDGFLLQGRFKAPGWFPKVHISIQYVSLFQHLMKVSKKDRGNWPPWSFYYMLDPRPGYFKNISFVPRDPLRHPLNHHVLAWCSLFLTESGRYRRSLYNPDFPILQLQDATQNKTQLATPRSAAIPSKVMFVPLCLLSGHHVLNNFYHTSHRMFSHLSNWYFYQEWKLPHVAWRRRSSKRAAASGFFVYLRTRPSRNAFSVLPGFQVNEHPDKPATVTSL